MRRILLPALVVLAASASMSAQKPEKELVATISGPSIKGGIVSELAWDGGTLIIQSVAMEPTGVMKADYFTVAAPSMDVLTAAAPPPGLDRYWKMKSSRVSPTGMGKITADTDAKLPMYGVASLEQRLQDVHEMGGTVQTQSLMLHDRLIHSRTTGIPPYDGEVWSWSPAELNRIAYVDAKGDLWIARADGSDAERVLKGNYTLPAWSEDGRTLAIAERKDGGRKWEISVIHLTEKFRN
jgi:hypothetical protein